MTVIFKSPPGSVNLSISAPCALKCLCSSSTSYQFPSLAGSRLSHVVIALSIVLVNILPAIALLLVRQITHGRIDCRE